MFFALAERRRRIEQDRAEMQRKCREEGRIKGLVEGYEEGRKKGYMEGFLAGQIEGRREAHSEMRQMLATLSEAFRDDPDSIPELLQEHQAQRRNRNGKPQA